MKQKDCSKSNMTLLWSGQWPRNRAPNIGRRKIYTEGDSKLHIYKTSSKVTLRVEAQDPDGDKLTIKWDIRKDESDNPSTGETGKKGFRRLTVPSFQQNQTVSPSSCPNKQGITGYLLMCMIHRGKLLRQICL